MTTLTANGGDEMNEGKTPQGWQCPECKVIYAPSVTQCNCAVGEATLTITSMWSAEDLSVGVSGVVVTGPLTVTYNPGGWVSHGTSQKQ